MKTDEANQKVMRLPYLILILILELSLRKVIAKLLKEKQLVQYKVGVMQAVCMFGEHWIDVGKISGKMMLYSEEFQTVTMERNL